MYIKKLELLNFQVIKEFNADFTGNIYFVTGENELGKSTLLKAIGALLTGQRDEVLKAGEKKGFAKMVIGNDQKEYEVSLSFTEANPRGNLTIKSKDSGMQSSNVSMLQKIFGYQDFDAVEFSRWSETAEGRRKQVAVVKNLLSPEIREALEKISKRQAEIKDERQGLNRDVKTFSTLVDSSKMSDSDVEKYKQPKDIATLIEQQTKIAQLNEKAKTVQSTLKQRNEQLQQIPQRREEIEKDYQVKLKQLNEEREQRLAEVNQLENDYKEKKVKCEKWLKVYDEEKSKFPNLDKAIAEAKEHNDKASKVSEYISNKKNLDNTLASVQKLESELQTLETEKKALINKSELPIKELSFTEEGLMLNGIPFVSGKVSDSQIMEVAAKLIIASNSTAKVFRIARGESLGTKRLQTIIDIAKKYGFQGFIEQVKRGQDEMLVEEYQEV